MNVPTSSTRSGGPESYFANINERMEKSKRDGASFRTDLIATLALALSFSAITSSPFSEAARAATS